MLHCRCECRLESSKMHTGSAVKACGVPDTVSLLNGLPGRWISSIASLYRSIMPEQCEGRIQALPFQQEGLPYRHCPWLLFARQIPLASCPGPWEQSAFPTSRASCKAGLLPTRWGRPLGSTQAGHLTAQQRAVFAVPRVPAHAMSFHPIAGVSGSRHLVVLARGSTMESIGVRKSRGSLLPLQTVACVAFCCVVCI